MLNCQRCYSDRIQNYEAIEYCLDCGQVQGEFPKPNKHKNQISIDDLYVGMEVCIVDWGNGKIISIDKPDNSFFISTILSCYENPWYSLNEEDLDFKIEDSVLMIREV